MEIYNCLHMGIYVIPICIVANIYNFIDILGCDLINMSEIFYKHPAE